MKRVMGLYDKNEEGDGIILIRMKRVMGLLDKNEEGDGIIR